MNPFSSVLKHFSWLKSKGFLSLSVHTHWYDSLSSPCLLGRECLCGGKTSFVPGMDVGCAFWAAR